jgi:hypothetical protein
LEHALNDEKVSNNILVLLTGGSSLLPMQVLKQQEFLILYHNLFYISAKSTAANKGCPIIIFVDQCWIPLLTCAANAGGSISVSQTTIQNNSKKGCIIIFVMVQYCTIVLSHQ